jgi:hypothetical protein
VILCISAVGFGQVTTSGLRGTVVDQSGGVVPGVEVTVSKDETSFARTTLSDDAGRYAFTQLPLGSYKLEAVLPGFKKYEVTGLILSADEIARLDPVLEIGQVSEVVEVTGAAVPLVKTETTEVSTLIESAQITQMPLNGRNIVQLATLTNGIGWSQVPSGIKENGNWGGNKLAVNGNRIIGVRFNLDGADIGDPRLNVALNYPNPQAVQEFRFVTSNYSAEYGKNSGGIMNVVTKSGTNEIHGAFWYFNRDNSLAATDFFLDEKPPLSQDQYGVSGGGPIVPDKLFWFGSVQWLKIAGEARTISNQFPPTAAERGGDFSQSLATGVLGAPIIDPDTGMQFPGNIIPADRLDPVVQEFFRRDLLPFANQPSGEWTGFVDEPLDNYHWLINFDYDMSDQNRFTFSLYKDYTETSSASRFGNAIPYTGGLSDFAQFQVPEQFLLVLNNTYTVSPTLINNFRFSFQDFSWTMQADGETINDWGGDWPTSTYETIGFNHPSGPPLFMTTSERAWRANSGVLWNILAKKYQFGEHMTAIHGAHQFKFGVEYNRINMDHISGGCTNGCFQGRGNVTGNGTADFMLGYSRVIAVSTADGSGIQNLWGFYLQDDWKATRNLTVNLGIRYQVAPWFSPVENRTWFDGRKVVGVTGFIEGQKSGLFLNAPAGYVWPESSGFAGDPGLPKRLVNTDLNDFGPRVGLAWDIRGNGRTSLRLGYGIFYSSPYGQNTDYTAENTPWTVVSVVPDECCIFNANESVLGGRDFPFPLREDADWTPYLPGNITTFEPNSQNAMVQQFNITLQQEVPGNTMLQAAYVGNVSQHLSFVYDTNTPQLVPDASGNPPDLSNGLERRRLNFPLLAAGQPAAYGGIRFFAPIANSAYHSLQLQARKRFARNWSFLSSYTWAKTLDHCSGGRNGRTGFISGCSQQQQLPPDLNRALSGLHQAHKWVSSFNYRMPSLTGMDSRVASAILGDWQWTGILTFGSGLPFTIGSGRNYSLQGGSDRPNLIGNLDLGGDRTRGQQVAEWFNTSAVVRNNDQEFGSLSRNPITGPSFESIDLAMYKNIPFTEGTNLQIRFEAFNIRNRANLGEPDFNLLSSTFGRISSNCNNCFGRIIQIGAMFTF